MPQYYKDLFSQLELSSYKEANNTLTDMLKISSSARIWTQITPKFRFAVTTTVNSMLFLGNQYF